MYFGCLSFLGCWNTSMQDFTEDVFLQFIMWSTKNNLLWHCRAEQWLNCSMPWFSIDIKRMLKLPLMCFEISDGKEMQAQVSHFYWEEETGLILSTLCFPTPLGVAWKHTEDRLGPILLRFKFSKELEKFWEPYIWPLSQKQIYIILVP